MSKDISILLLDNGNKLLKERAGQIESLGFKVFPIAGVPEMDSDIFSEEVAIVMAHRKLLRGTGEKRFREVIGEFPDAAVIFMIDEAEKIGSLNDVIDGIYDYLHVPASNSHMKHVIDIAIDRRARFMLEKYYQKYLETQVTSQLQELADKQVRLLHADRLSSIGQVAAGIIHEMNNPLMYMKLSIENMEMLNTETGRVLKEYGKEHDSYSYKNMSAEEMAGELADMMKSVTKGLDHIEKILKNMRRLSQKPKTHKTEFDIHQAISNALNFAKGALKKHIVIKKDFHEGLPPLIGDPQTMEQVILNILINASHALEEVEKGEITIKTEMGKSKGLPSARVLISDNGPGIRSEIVDKIFDPFFTTKSQEKGTGLGLSICREIVTEFSGTIKVESENGHGATFILLLPVGEEA